MCRIFGVVNDHKAAQTPLSGLKALEYRGYDSAGIATIDNSVIDCCRANGKLNNLENALQQHPLPGSTGIAHTRWATHGEPTTTNAHPHMTDDVALVHNGIIENYQELRTELEKKGHVFSSGTDSEVLPMLISDTLRLLPQMPSLPA